MPERFVLVIEAGPRAGERISIAGDRFTVGRKPGNSLVLNDASVSGSHCEIRSAGDGLVLKDLGSTNGTFFGGAKVLEVKLSSGDQFALGTVMLRVEGDADELVLDEESPVAASGPAGLEILDLVEDSPAPGASAPSPSAAPMAERAAVIVAPRSEPARVPSPGDSGVLTDSGVVERARRAAAEAAKRGRFTTIAIAVAAVVAIGLGGYFAFFAGGEAAPRMRSVAAVAGNLLDKETASLEAAAGDGARTEFHWQLRDTSLLPADDNETGTAAKGVGIFGFGFTTKRIHSGERALETRFDGPGIARATSDPVSVGSGQSLKFAAHVATGLRSGAAVQLVFRSRSDPNLRIVRCGGSVGFAEPSGKGGFTRVEGTAQVPSGCNQACVSIVGFGADDSVVFDDVELLPSSEAAAAPVMRKEIEFEPEPIDGRIRKIGRDFARNLGVLHRDASGAGKRTFLAGRTDANDWILWLPTGEGAQLSLSLEPTDTQVAYHYQWKGKDAGDPKDSKWTLNWGIDRAYAPEILVRGAKATGRYRGEFREPAATALVFGEERDRLRLSFQPPVAVHGVPDTNQTSLEIDAPATFTITVQFTFEAEKRRAFELEQQADAAEKGARFGEAIALRGQILEEFPFETALIERNQTKRDASLGEGQRAVQKLEKRIADAELFRIPEGFREAKRAAEKLGSDYAGTDVAERAKTVVEAADRSLSVTEAERGEREAARLKNIADAFKAIQATELANYIREYIKKHFANTKAAAAGDGN